MNFKPKRYFFAIFLLCTVATAGSKPSADPTQPTPRAAWPHDRNRLLSNTGGLYRPANRGDGRRFRLDLPPREGSRGLGDVPGERTGRPRRPGVTSVTGEGARSRKNPRRVLVSPRPPTDDCVAGKVESVTPGRVYISGQLEVSPPNVGYQADSAFPGDKITGIFLFYHNSYCVVAPTVTFKFPQCSVELFRKLSCRQLEML